MGIVDSACACHACSLKLRNASPGGSIQPFCEAVATTSHPQASVSMGMEHTLLMPSTSRSLPNSPLTTLAIACKSLVTPVEVSLCVTSTAFHIGVVLKSVSNLVHISGTAKGKVQADDLRTKEGGNVAKAHPEHTNAHIDDLVAGR